MVINYIKNVPTFFAFFTATRVINFFVQLKGYKIGTRNMFHLGLFHLVLRVVKYIPAFVLEKHI